MKCIVLSFIFTTVEIYISTATERLYVLPDKLTNENATSCPSQPCATLNQYLLDDGTLPVVSNVEYHFLPGEHHVPANMILQNLHNFSIIGTISNSSSPIVLVGYLQWYVINIIDSHFVTIKNVIFKQCSILADNKTELTNLNLFCCFSCKIQNVTFMQYGLIGFNLIGESYLYNIKIQSMEFSPQLCCQVVLLQYTDCLLWNNYSTYSNMHHVSIDRLSIYDYTNYNTLPWDKAGLFIHMGNTTYHLKIILKNSYFCNMDRTALYIKGRYSLTTKQIFVTNCTFKFISASFSAIVIFLLSPFNGTLSFINCEFHSNKEVIIISIAYCGQRTCKLTISNVTFPMILTNISFVRCQFINNTHRLLMIENNAPTLVKVNVSLKSLNILHNVPLSTMIQDNMILISNMNVHISGNFNVTKNRYRLSIMQFQSCDVLLSGKITFNENHCGQVILLDTYIKIMEYTNITFKNNGYLNNIISIEGAEEYYQPYPFCIFQYIPMHNNVTLNDLLSRYFVTFTHNYEILLHHVVINLNGTTLHSQNYIPSVLFCRFISHCKWLPLGAFYGYSPVMVNQKIVKTDDQINCNYHKHICYCSHSQMVNCSIDTLGMVYPGQTLQTSLCNMYSSDDSTILYAEVHNINLPNSSCKIAHQSQLLNYIGNHSNTVNYTIVLGTSDNDRCALFLTASPFLNKIYDIFYVQLLPCPLGFTLQGGVCHCDPILLRANFDKCYIDRSAIRRPANTWITAHSQANNTAYLISDCPIDFCLPYSSNVNLLHPDLQCQFNRTGILCSQCQHHLSMVFGSSRCMKCTNLHILITIIVLVAGIALVVFLYFLNLTVTIGTINSIIFYANIISINNSVFLVNENVLKPLRVFISFANLDLGIETCFYNGMDSYIKTWLQLFFPLYLIIIAMTIIIASRYSYRILRLTYTRSLPVLATLFLLSYTGVLRTVLTVLFSYSTITHLPSNHKQIVWSIDASVPLFGLKFTILFITCLVLFLLLIPFNITLLFTRYLLQFSLINHFKPLIDAFQGSYKDRYYYWVAVNITLRSMFFALYGFQTKTRLIIATLILNFFTAYHGYTHPYKSKLMNIQELLLLVNLTMMYAVSYQSSENVFFIVTNVMISLAFIQFCAVVLYHFLTYTCHYDIVSKLKSGKQMIKYITKKNKSKSLNYLELLDIPECTYNYTEYQDGLVSDDFR